MGTGNSQKPTSSKRGRRTRAQTLLKSGKEGFGSFFFEDEPEPDNGPSRLILTHGYRKQTDETPDQEIDHFLYLRDQYYRHKFDAE